MGRGAWLPAVRFDSELRKELARVLRGHDVSAIVADLERCVEMLPAFKRPARRRSARDTLEELRTAAAEFQRRLVQLADDEDVDDRVFEAVALLGRDLTELRMRLLKDLEVLDAAIDASVEMLRSKAKGGRPRNLKGFWLVEQVVAVLGRHGVKISTNEDGVGARVIRALWPYVRPGGGAPLELKPWFKLLKSQQ